MRITGIYDNGGKTLDRYTVLTDEPFTRGRETVNALGLSEGGAGFSQWGEAMAGRHLGRQVRFEELSAPTQAHIAYRCFGDNG